MRSRNMGDFTPTVLNGKVIRQPVMHLTLFVDPGRGLAARLSTEQGEHYGAVSEVELRRLIDEAIVVAKEKASAGEE